MHMSSADHLSDDPDQAGLRNRITGQAEDAIGRLADDLIENPVINSALSHAASARERVAQAQQSAMDALNLPSASELEKLGRRLRSISQRLEEVEDAVEKIGMRVEAIADDLRAPGTQLSDQLSRMDARLEQLGRDVGTLRRDVTREGVAGEPPAIVPEG
jgi:DNA repair ATPase RecN